MFELSGATINFERKSNPGASAVFIHGFGGDLHTWDRIWPFLKGDRQLLRYDLRGFGHSLAKSNEAFTHVDDLAELVMSQNESPCDVVGVSMGGGIALSFALSHPNMVRSVILISPQLLGWEWSSEWNAKWEAMTAEARAGRFDAARRMWWEHPLFESTRASAAANDLCKEISRFPGRQWIKDEHALIMPDIERLHRLERPALLLTGARDVEELRLMADVLEASSTHIVRVDIEGHGHLLHMEAPELCARRIENFLQ